MYHNYGHIYIPIKESVKEGLVYVDTEAAIKQAKEVWISAGSDIEKYTWLAFSCYDMNYVYTGMVLVVNIYKPLPLLKQILDTHDTLAP